MEQSEKQSLTHFSKVGWLTANWLGCGALLSVVLFCLLPLVALRMELWLTLVYAQLLFYLIHQLEEHRGDRFRLFINRELGGGAELLTPRAVMVINVFGVWGVDLLSLELAFFFHPGYGLIAVYLTLVNAIVHIVSTVAFKKYNPGLVTAIAFFLPLSLFSLFILWPVGMYFHLQGIAVAIGIHAAIVMYVKRRKSR